MKNTEIDMPVPAIDSNSLIDELNELRDKGVTQDNNFLFRNFQRRIEAYKSTDIVMYWLNMASLHCIFGNVADSIKAGETGLRLTSDLGKIMHQLVTLSNIAAFKQERELIGRVDDLIFVDSEENVAYHLLECGAFSLCAEIGSKYPEQGSTVIKIGSAASKVLADRNVDEKLVHAMIDLAGDVVQSRRLLLAENVEINVYNSDKTISITFPLAVSPAEAARIEWDFSGRLFTEQPNCPATVVNIGFIGTKGLDQ